MMDIIGINNTFNRLFMRMLNIVVTAAEQYYSLMQWEYGYIDEMKAMTEGIKAIKQSERSKMTEKEGVEV